MMKNYIQMSLLILVLSLTNFGHSQTIQPLESKSDKIEGLTIYPNPVSNGKLYISTLKNTSKDVEIFDVLGKKIYASSFWGTSLDISKLNSGVYIIKVTENNITATRKLIVK
jgi:myo-inositol-hexaphosphate 3-phosphohydrolase